MENLNNINNLSETIEINETFFKTVTAGNTITWHRPEQNIIYLMSEFIDNSKASYENLMSNSNCDFTKKMPIDIIFNQHLGYIAFKDLGQGFNIQKSVEKIGRDEMNIGSTNQYFIGMKSAMNYFGNFSILISERIINGVNYRYANYFIFKNGLHPMDFELEATGQTGSEIYLFENYDAAQKFWFQLNFKNNNNSFPPFEILNLLKMDNYSMTEEILNNLKIMFPVLSASLFERYSPLVAKHPNIEILFHLFDKENIDINTNDNSMRLELPTRARSYPQYYTKIENNDWETDRSFSFQKLLTNSENNDIKRFKNELNQDVEFKREIEKLLFNDIKNHFNKAKTTNSLLDEIKSEQLGKNISYDVKWIGNAKENKNYDFVDKELWDEYPFAKDLASIFMNGLTKSTGAFSHIKFKISNLILTSHREIIYSHKFDDETFDLIFDLNVLSNRYLNSIDYPWGPVLSDNMAGFALIQNNRAIYHGPNFDPLSKDYVSWSREWPSRFLATDLKNGNPKAFPFYYSSKNYPTYVTIGGNTSRWSSKIFGSITLPNGDIFNAGTNKAQISNLKSLENFTLDVLRDSAINVFSRWVHLFDQKAIVGSPTNQEIKNYNRTTVKNRDGIILLDVLHTIEWNKQLKNGAFNSETGVIDTEQVKQVIGSNYYKKLEYAILGEHGLKKTNDSSIPELIAKDEKSIAKYAIDFLKTAKNNEWSILKIKKIELNDDNKTIVITLDKTFRKWKQFLAIKFDSQNSKNDWTYTLEDNEPIIITIPLDVTKTDIPTLMELINKQLQKLYYHLAMITGFYHIAAKKKVNPQANLNWTEDTIETYLADALDHFVDVEIEKN